MCATCGCDHESSVLIRKVEAAKTLDLQGLQLTKLPTAAEPPGEFSLIWSRIFCSKTTLRRSGTGAILWPRISWPLTWLTAPVQVKTSLLERTLSDLNGDLTFSVIEGDQQTTNDADRIAATGAPVVQINTGKGCHLDADMIENAIKS